MAITHKTTDAFEALSLGDLVVSVADLANKLTQSSRQPELFKRQMFVQKSEKRFRESPNQLGFDIEGMP